MNSINHLMIKFKHQAIRTFYTRRIDKVEKNVYDNATPLMSRHSENGITNVSKDLLQGHQRNLY